MHIAHPPHNPPNSLLPAAPITSDAAPGLGRRFRYLFYADVAANAAQLAEYAVVCQEAGLVPIVEPEVLIDGAHSAPASAAALPAGCSEWPAA